MSIPELCSTHEEADTRLLLHAAHASRQGFANVVIRSADTDVAVLALSFSADIAAHLFFRTGVKNRTRVIDMNLLSEKHGEAVCRALPGLHALTGCDTTSAFVGRGKKQALCIVSDPASVEARRSLTRLGHAFTVTDDLMRGIEKFVCQLYGSSEHSSINDLRYNMFCLKAAQSSQLPPCQRCTVPARLTC